MVITTHRVIIKYKGNYKNKVLSQIKCLGLQFSHTELKKGYLLIWQCTKHISYTGGQTTHPNHCWVPSHEYSCHSRHTPLILCDCSIYVYKLQSKYLSQISTIYICIDKRDRSGMTRESWKRKHKVVCHTLPITLSELGGTLALKHPEAQANGIT